MSERFSVKYPNVLHCIAVQKLEGGESVCVEGRIVIAMGVVKGGGSEEPLRSRLSLGLPVPWGRALTHLNTWP